MSNSALISQLEETLKALEAVSEAYAGIDMEEEPRFWQDAILDNEAAIILVKENIARLKA